MIASERERQPEHNTLAHRQAVMSALMAAVTELAPSIQVGVMAEAGARPPPTSPR